eukprot:s3055_g1.t1
MMVFHNSVLFESPRNSRVSLQESWWPPGGAEPEPTASLETTFVPRVDRIVISSSRPRSVALRGAFR